MDLKNKKCQKAFHLLFLILLWICVCITVYAENKVENSGRYMERVIELPEEAAYDGMALIGENGYALYGLDTSLLITYEDGMTEEITDSWKKTGNINAGITNAVSSDGKQIYVYLPKLSEEEYKKLGNRMTPYAYYLVDKSGRKKSIEPYGEGYNKEMQLNYFEFSPEGALFASDVDGNVFQMDTETGELKFLFQAVSEIKEFCFGNGILIAADEANVWFYDLSAEQLADGYEVLDMFIESHQGDGRAIALCLDHEKDNILYVGCRTGIYRYVFGGTVVEQIIDGQQLSFGNSYYEIRAMQSIGYDEFRVYFSPGHLVEIYFDKTVSDKTEKTLYIYSLEENERIRNAIQIFQRIHPEVRVKYETGMNGDYAVSKEEAIKNLNTKILSDESPDIFVLDGMDIEQYAKKGVLKNLDDLLQPYLENGVLFENVVQGMRREDDSICALPMTIWPYVWSGERKYLEGHESLEDLVNGLQAARDTHPEGMLIYIRSEEELLEFLIPSSIAAWIRESGMDSKKLTEFYEHIKQIWDLNVQGVPEEEWIVLQNYANQNNLQDTFLWNITNTTILDFENEHIWENFGYFISPYPPVSTAAIHITCDNINRGFLKKDMDLWFGSLNGQVGNVYRGLSIIGLGANAKEPKLAEEFFQLLLGEQIMDKWWLNRGIPIRKDSVEKAMDINNFDYMKSLGYSEESARMIFQTPKWWPSEEIQTQFWEILNAAEILYQPDTALEEIVTEYGIDVCRGMLTPEEAAREVEGKIAIAIEE